ncbi:MAG: beta-glucosidase [Rhizomicrobium sp.]|jgi:beta-glucosidase
MTGKISHARIFSLLAAAAFVPVAALAQSAAQPWMDASLSPDARADLVQAQMTEDEELMLVDGYFAVYPTGRLLKPAPEEVRKDLPGSAGYVRGVPRLGIPALRESDASLGVANGRHMRPGDTATALPSTLLTAATFNAELAYADGAMIGKEAHEKGFNVLLAGGIDLARDPRNGRVFEYVGEDPLLAGVIAGEAIRGTQDQHIISTIKHYAVNDQETGRHALSANIADAAARESDLLAFEIAIEHGDPGAVMCAYNRVNGVYSCENDYLLNKVLKGDWSYKGFVLSDWGAVHSTVDSAVNGLDQESANEFDKQDFFGDALKQALADGKVPQARLHDMAHRILRSMFKSGLFEHPVEHTAINEKGDAAVAQRDAEEGIVLLKNKRNLLPLSARTHRIALIGGHADLGVLSGGGSSQVVPIGNKPEHEFLLGGSVLDVPGYGPQMPADRMILDPPAPLTTVRAAARGARVVYDDGSDLAKAVKLARASDVAVVFVEQWMREGADVPDLSLHGGQDALIEAVAAANPHTIVVLETGGPVLMPWLDKVGAVLEAWYPGGRGAEALARILVGAVNPSGRLPITFPQSESQLPRPVIPGIDIHEPPIQWLGTQIPFDVNYTEGTNAGYKWFAVQKLMPLFPFGYGLSYTSFRYGGLRATGGATLTVSFNVRNTGKREGKATAQVYAAPPTADGHGVARLVGWSKVDLKPGEMRHVTLSADPRLLATFDTTAHVWQVAAGDYAVTLGGSSADASATANVHIDASTIKP